LETAGLREGSPPPATGLGVSCELGCPEGCRSRGEGGAGKGWAVAAG
jgi:hypothetical protein